MNVQYRIFMYVVNKVSQTMKKKKSGIVRFGKDWKQSSEEGTNELTG